MQVKVTLTINIDDTDDINSDGWYIHDQIESFVRSGNVIPNETLVDNWHLWLEVKENKWTRTTNYWS